MTDAPIMKLTPQPPPAGFWRSVWWRYRHNGRGVLGLAIVMFLLLTAFFSPLLASDQPIVCRYKGTWYFPAIVELFQSRQPGPHWINKADPFNKPQFNAKRELGPDDWAIWPLVPYREYEQSLDHRAPPSREHWLGTDELGRDILARMIHGTTVAVKVGFVSMAIAALIGIVLGGMAGYFGGAIDTVISRAIEIVICFPTFFLILSISVWVSDPSITYVMVIIGLTRWTSIARYTRGEYIRINSLDFVMAARALGLSHRRIMFRHILPNALTPVMVSITFGVADAILIESGLSWLGFGVQSPDPSWGNMLRSAYDHLRVSPHMVFPPCVAIFLAVLAYNLVGDALRDAIDPHLTKAAH